MIDEITQKYIEEHLEENPIQLALKPMSKGVNKQVALEQIEAHQKALAKLPSLAKQKGIIFPPRISMEQCSSELTALYKRELLGENYRLLDLTGGFGIDAYYMNATTYIEQNEHLCNIAKHNFNLLQSTTEVINSTAEEYLQSGNQYDVIFLDPARRGANGNKVFLLNDCSPSVIDLLPQLYCTAPRIIIKLSPMLDITSIINQLDGVMRIDVLSVDNECKELIIILQKGFHEEPIIKAINISKNGEYSRSVEASYEEERNCIASYSNPLKYLYEPYAAHIKSGLYNTIAKQFNVKQIARDTHLYTANEYVDDFVGRKFEIIEILPFNNKMASQYFKNNPQANVTIRNFPISVAELRKRYHIKEGGERYIFFTTLTSNDKVMIICNKK